MTHRGRSTTWSRWDTEMRLMFGVHVEAGKLVLTRFSCFDLCAKWDECPLDGERPDWKVKHSTLSDQLNISFQAHLFSDIYIQILYQYWKTVTFSRTYCDFFLQYRLHHNDVCKEVGVRFNLLWLIGIWIQGLGEKCRELPAWMQSGERHLVLK